tara:strand:- start:8411 stop:8641 length:231 start_codon:yes stop_codon:yes gene_type:complete
MAMVEDQKEDQWWDLGPEGIPWERYPGVVTWDIDHASNVRFLMTVQHLETSEKIFHNVNYRHNTQVKSHVPQIYEQ